MSGHAQSGYPGGPHYDVTYSGGQWQSSGGPNLPLVAQQGSDSGGENGSTYGGGYVAYGPPGYAASVSATGQITATFTWKPTAANEPPPASAIVEEDGAASYGTSGPATGSCDDGVGDVSPVGGTSASLSGTKYVVQSNPGATFTVTCSPSASASGPADPNGTYGNAWVSFKAAAYPVLVRLHGTTLDSSQQDNILIGQGCIGYLSAGPATFSDFQWDAGGDTFDRFDVAPDLSTGHVVPLSADTWTRQSPLWHYSKDSNGSTITVKCSATASINGTVIGTVQGQRDVQVWAPYYAFKNMAGPVSVDNIEGYLEVYAGGPPVGGAGSGDWDPPGMKNGGRVGTPNLFLSAGAGIWQFIQLIHPGRWFYYTDGTGSPVTAPLNFNGMQMLDNEYPYPNSSDSPAPPWPADSANPPPTGSTVTTYWMDDSPGDQLLNSFFRFRADESFDDYMMYDPPDSGDGSQWVPLHLFQWKWQADVSRTGPSWVSGWTPSPPGYTSNLSSNRCTTHPFWQSRLTNGAMQY